MVQLGCWGSGAACGPMDRPSYGVVVLHMHLQPQWNVHAKRALDASVSSDTMYKEDALYLSPYPEVDCDEYVTYSSKWACASTRPVRPVVVYVPYERYILTQKGRVRLLVLSGSWSMYHRSGW